MLTDTLPAMPTLPFELGALPFASAADPVAALRSVSLTAVRVTFVAPVPLSTLPPSI